GDGEDAAVRVRVEAVRRPVGVQPGDPVAERSADLGERTADEDLAVRLREDGPDEAVHGARIEAVVDRSVRIQASDQVASRPTHRREAAPDEDLSVRLDG